MAAIGELSEQREHFRWIKQSALRLQSTVPHENAVAHAAIAYSLCRSTAVLNVPLIELQPVVAQLLAAYLRSSHRFVRNAALRGVLCLLESYAASNTAIGRLSDELALVRQLAVAYVQRRMAGCLAGGSGSSGGDQHRTSRKSATATATSDEHARLVWSLAFYVAETTSKFCGSECTLLAAIVQAAAGGLQRLANMQLYGMIVGVSMGCGFLGGVDGE